MLGLLLSVSVCAQGGIGAKATVWGAEWCPACKQMKPSVLQLQRDGWLIEYKSVDDFPAEAMDQIGSGGIPATIIQEDGKTVERAIGLRPLAALKELFRKHNVKHQTIQASVPTVESGIKAIAWYADNCPEAQKVFRELQKEGWSLLVYDVAKYPDIAKLWNTGMHNAPRVIVYDDTKTVVELEHAGVSGTHIPKDWLQVALKKYGVKKK